MHNFKNTFLLVILSLTLSGCAKTTMLRTATDYQHSLPKLRNVVVLPPIVEVNAIDAGGKAVRQHDYEYQLEQNITDVLVERLHAKGYAIKPVTKKAIHDFKLSRKVLAFQEEYQGQIDALYSPLLWEEKKAFAIETFFKTDTQELQNSINADAIMFVEYYGKSKTSGASAKDFAIGLFVPSHGNAIEDSAEFISLRLAIIDPTTHKILWSNLAREGYGAFSSAFSNMSSLEKVDKKRINKLLDTILDKLPAR